MQLREVTREWGKLQLCLADELESYASSHPAIEPSVVPTARRVWMELCTEGASESVAKYFQLCAMTERTRKERPTERFL